MHDKFSSENMTGRYHSKGMRCHNVTGNPGPLKEIILDQGGGRKGADLAGKTSGTDTGFQHC